MKKKILVLPFLILPLFLLGKNESVPPPPEPKIGGVILPHHELADELFHDSFMRLKEKVNPKTIVVFGTNHYFPLSETFTTTLEADIKYNFEGVLVDNERIANEHSIQVVSKYIDEYFPEVEIVPIIVSDNLVNFEDIEWVINTNFLDKFSNPFYIASVDFAHEVSLEEGLAKNDESIKSVANFDYDTILDYEDDHMDSPLSIITLLKVMEKLGFREWDTWHSSHGGLLENQLDYNGTSYVVGVFESIVE